MGKICHGGGRNHMKNADLGYNRDMKRRKFDTVVSWDSKGLLCML